MNHPTKPVKQLHQAYLAGDRLHGFAPADLEGGNDITITSRIVAQTGDFVETMNSIYHVLDWYGE